MVRIMKPSGSVGVENKNANGKITSWCAAELPVKLNEKKKRELIFNNQQFDLFFFIGKDNVKQFKSVCLTSS